VTAEVDDPAIGYVKEAIVAGVAACPYPEGVMSRIERRLDRFMAADRPDALAIDRDLEGTAPEFQAEGLPRQPESC
jgi:hypothetical protein